MPGKVRLDLGGNISEIKDQLVEGGFIIGGTDGEENEGPFRDEEVLPVMGEVEIPDGEMMEQEIVDYSENDPVAQMVELPISNIRSDELFESQEIEEEKTETQIKEILDKNTEELTETDIQLLRIEVLKRDNPEAIKKLAREKLKQTLANLKEVGQEKVDIIEEDYHHEKNKEDLDKILREEKAQYDQVSKLKDDIPLNVWNIIDTYFRDNKYYKSKHQLDSYNEFITSKTNGIEYIIKRENPLIIYKDLLSNGKFRYEITFYFGETLDDQGVPIAGKENLFLTSPTIYDSDTKKMSYMYPNDARLRSLTYAMYIFCNIGVKIIDNIGDSTKEPPILPGEMRITNYEKENIGILPIMLHSKSCILNNLDSQKLNEMGECRYDQGGYFIIKGKEKVILSQEKKVNNVLYINKSPDENIILQGIIKSVSKEGFQSSRTNAISFVKSNVIINKNSPLSKTIESKRFLVRILGLDIKIPLFIIFRALGVETDKDILNMIIYDNDSDTLKNKLLDVLQDTIKDAMPIYTQKNSYKFLSLNTKGKEIINVIDILNNNFLPTYETNNIEKAKYLAYAVRKIILTHINVIKETDRDSYAVKRIDTAGPLLLELFRELWGKFQKNISLKIDAEFKFNFDKIEKDIFKIVDSNKDKIIDNSIMNQISKSFGSVFGSGVSAKQGIVQDLNRNSMLGALSHIRRLITPLAAGSKTIGPRKLHGSQWGFVCPTESPDGGNVGIVNHLSIISTISFNILETGIIECLKDNDLLELKDSINKDLYSHSKVFMNGKLIGFHKEAEFLVKLLKLLKLNSIINIYTSISWNIDLNEIYIYTDSGRIVRPILVLKYDKDGKKINDLIQGKNELLENWDKLIHGYLYGKEDVSVYSDDYYKQYLDDIKKKEPNYLEFLQEKASPIEYIDSTESEFLFIAKDIYSIDKDYTHCEIHSSLILSPLALQIPFPEHSQFPRNVFSCQQTKQAVGVYSSAYNTRFDTFGHVLSYPQKALVTTRYKKYTHVDKLPNGENIVVAICSYLGYNQEDSIMVNKSSIDRGMFNSMYFRSYEDNEEVNKSNNTSFFSNPNQMKNNKIKNIDAYSKLNNDGIVEEGTYVKYGDKITSKCEKHKLPDGTETTVISGMNINRETSGTVDKVIITRNKDNLKKCKIRIYKQKIPTVGDKYASRCGQKGMCGMVLEQWEMPFTKDGIVPDLMINPHAIPSRMTINQFLEVVLGKTCAITGHFGDGTPFQNNSVEHYADMLGKLDYEQYGNEVMYSGINGEQIKTSIFIGPTYYQRLKIMVADKMFSRATGPMQMLIKQPAAGRSNGGGLRIGEMERDSILGHGTAGFLKESMMERADKYMVQINKHTGLIDYDNNSSENCVNIAIPYAMKMLLQELETMSIAPRVIIDEKINNETIFTHINELYNNMNSENMNTDNMNSDPIDGVVLDDY